MQVTPYLLVGGKSSRMGRDKAFLPWRGTTLLQHAIERLATFGPVRLLSGDVANAARAAQLAPFGPLVADRTPNSGPLGGVDAALQDSPTEWALILPIDQPLLPAEVLVDWSHRVTASDALASWFALPGGPEPLPLLVHRRLAELLARSLADGQRRLLLAVEAAAGPKLYAAPADSPDWFVNLNRPQDLEEFTQAQQLD